jgi:hypothetical protein
MDEAKPFKIPKREVWEAFKRVKANQGAAGVDGQSIAQFEADLSGNLYKLWNRLSMGQKRRSPRCAGTAGIPLTADMWTMSAQISRPWPSRPGSYLALIAAPRVAPAAEDYWRDWYRIWIFARLARYWRAVEDQPQPHRQSPCHRPRDRLRRS